MRVSECAVSPGGSAKRGFFGLAVFVDLWAGGVMTWTREVD